MEDGRWRVFNWTWMYFPKCLLEKHHLRRAVSTHRMGWIGGYRSVPWLLKVAKKGTNVPYLFPNSWLHELPYWTMEHHVASLGLSTGCMCSCHRDLFSFSPQGVCSKTVFGTALSWPQGVPGTEKSYPWALAWSNLSMLLRNNFRVAGSRLGPISVRTKAFERSAIEKNIP